MARPTATNERAWQGRHLHFVGIGGVGMSGLALIAAALGASVTGSDRVRTPYMDRLGDRGIEPVIGYDADNVPGDAEVVYSSAVAADNPERRVAATTLHRADLLAEVSRLRPCVAVTGTHGKTTTSSMLVHALRGAGEDPSYIIGGDLRATGCNAEWRSGEWLVVEADESDRSLLKLAPQIAVLTNAELDHHATYGSLADVEATFAQFLSGSGRAVVWDRPGLRRLAGDDAIAYDAADIEADGAGVRFSWEGLSVSLAVPGAHNAVNAAGALTAAALTGADRTRAAAALADFAGARRRLELLGVTSTGARVYDDYAHHPTEVAAVIAAARSMGARRVLAVFQPHLFSRTRALAREFGRALAGADAVVVLGIYPARERAADFPGVDARAVATAAADAPGRRSVAWLPTAEVAESHLRSMLRDGDVCLVMGAGDVDALGRALVLAAPSAPGRA